MIYKYKNENNFLKNSWSTLSFVAMFSYLVEVEENGRAKKVTTTSALNIIPVVRCPIFAKKK